MQKGNISTDYRKQLVGRIIKVATQEFKQKGIKIVKMDDIAKILSVSKRTVYEIFENKEQLLMACVAAEHKWFEQEMTAYATSGDRTVVDLVLMFYRLQMRVLRGVSPAYIVELHRFKSISNLIECKRKERQQHTRNFYKMGIEQGLFRKDVNFELIDRVLESSMSHIILDKIYEQYEPIEVFRNIVMLYLRGFCTLKGIEELEKNLES